MRRIPFFLAMAVTTCCQASSSVQSSILIQNSGSSSWQQQQEEEEQHQMIPDDILAAAPTFGMGRISVADIHNGGNENENESDNDMVTESIVVPPTLPKNSLRSSSSTVEQTPKIVGGNEAQRGEYKFFVQLLGNALCGASLIAPDLVLTASHCWWPGLEFVAVNVWEVNREIGDEKGDADHVRIERAVRHPRYNLASFSDSDFMLLKLTRPVDNAEIIGLHKDFELPGGEYATIGLGRREPDDRFSVGGKLQELVVEETPFDVCNREMFNGVVRESTMICAGVPGLKGDGDACQGDSGGPLFYYDADNQPIQIGVISFGYRECATKDLASVYARVSYAYPWIRGVACETFDSTYEPLCGDYIPGSAGSSGEVSFCNPGNETLFQFLIRTDDNGDDLSWNLQNVDTGEVLFTDSDFSDREVRLYEGCLSNDVQCHTLTIRDSGSNPGFCCDGVDNGVCCSGWQAGFGVIFGTASAVYFENPTFEHNTVTLNLCQPDPVDETEVSELSEEVESVNRTLSQTFATDVQTSRSLESQSNDFTDYSDTFTGRRLGEDDESKDKKQKEHKKKYIRGVNIGGWLMAERFIAPYLFAVNSCHLQGSLCWYPGQMGAPQNLTTIAANATMTHSTNVTATTAIGPPSDPYKGSINTLCDPTVCQPILNVRAKKPTDYNERGWRPFMTYPVDEWTLGQTLRSSTGGFEMAQKYMERHWDTFLAYDDLRRLKNAGVTHLRIPMSYWIRGDIAEGEPYIPGGWPFFVRAAKWCRRLGLTIWADLHGAPGSENGFDNSGIFKGVSTCKGWDENPANVERTVNILTDIAHGIVEDGLQDVVTGFGVLNEPFVDCDQTVVRNYYDQALSILRTTLGSHVSVFVGDTFRTDRFNDGFWTDAEVHHDTYLDSHPYHVFFEQGRSFTPRQHIAYVCRHDASSVEDCCWEDPPNNTIPSEGISRIIGEWSGAYDALPTAMTPFIMKRIETAGQAPYLNRVLSTERKEFLRNFVEAQMVAYEARDVGISSGWLFWNFKMEGGAFAEWDFLRGVREKWMPQIPHPTVPSEDVFGSCIDIYNKTTDDYAIVDEYPDPRTLDWAQWQGWSANDDFVMSDPNIPDATFGPTPWYKRGWVLPMFLIVVCTALLRLRSFASWKRRERLGYTELKMEL